MSISGSLSNALSGMTAAARTTEVISSNVANAMTDGYGRRVLETSSRVVGGSGSGVKVDGVRRDIDLGVLADRRLSDAQLGGAQVQADFLATLETLVGQPGEDGALTTGFADLEAALIEAASRPDSDERLSNVLSAAQDLGDQFRRVSDGIQAARKQADDKIAATVELLNDRLAKVADLNGQIRRQDTAGTSIAALADQRQALIDEISDIVPLRQVDRDGGQVALFTTTGGILLDGKPAEFGFTAAGAIVPEMTFAGGALSGLSLNGQEIETSGPYGPIAGGSLAALFDQRDNLAPAMQVELDALARDLVERFQDSGLDATITAGQPGLFTDGGAAFDTVNELGLSARLEINAVADPSRGGDLWRLRDGLYATAPGLAGNGQLLTDTLAAMSDHRPTASGRFSGESHAASDLAGAFLSHVSGSALSAEADRSYAEAKHSALVATELEGGVDTDRELQLLLQVEQAYAANARVIQTIDDMINRLIGI